MNDRLSAQEAVCRLLAATWDPRSLPPSEAIPWPEVLPLVQGSNVAGAVFCAARGMAGGVPAGAQQALEHAYYLSITQNTRILHQLGRVGAALSGAGRPLLLLKGGALSQTLFADPGSRLIGDIDVVVSPEHVPACRQILIDQGYVPVHFKPRSGSLLEFDNQEAFEPPSRYQTPVELHWHILDVPYYLRRVPMAWFWENAEECVIAGQPFRVLAPEANLVYLPAHLALHHKFEGLHSYLDLALLVVKNQNRLDWPRIVAAARSFELLSALTATLDRLAAWWPSLPIDEPRRLLQGIRPSPMDARLFRLLTAGSGSKTMEFYARVVSMPDFPARVHFVWQELFPQPAYMMGRYPVKARWRLPFWYLYRVLDGLVRYLCTLRSARRLER